MNNWNKSLSDEVRKAENRVLALWAMFPREAMLEEIWEDEVKKMEESIARINEMIIESRNKRDGDLGKAKTLQEAILAWQMDLVDELISGNWEIPNSFMSSKAKLMEDFSNPFLDDISKTTYDSPFSVPHKTIIHENFIIPWDLSRFRINTPILKLSDEEKKELDLSLEKIDSDFKKPKIIFEKIWVFDNFDKYDILSDEEKELLKNKINLSFLNVDWNSRIFVYRKDMMIKREKHFWGDYPQLVFRIDVADNWEIISYHNEKWVGNWTSIDTIKMLDGIPFFKDLKEKYSI